jgi:hypothetical protein
MSKRWKAFVRSARWRLDNLASASADHREKKVLDDVARYGWHILVVMSAADDAPWFAYTIGLYESFGHPEIITFGLAHPLMARLLNFVGQEAKAGREQAAGTRVSGLLDGLDCTFATFPRSEYHARLGYALWYYDSSQFPVLQLFWPDRDGRFPWDPEADSHARRCQPGWERVPQT